VQSLLLILSLGDILPIVNREKFIQFQTPVMRRAAAVSERRSKRRSTETPQRVSSPESCGSSTSRQLHWLPVRRRMDFKFKISTLVYRSLAGVAHVYLAMES